MQNFDLLRILLIITVIIYFIYDYFEGKQIKDEREELIRLKTYELVHKATTTTLCALAVLYFFFPGMPALYPVLAVVFSFLYTEIVGKIYFRKKY